MHYKNQTRLNRYFGILLMLGSVVLAMHYVQNLNMLLSQTDMNMLFYENLALLCTILIKSILGFIASYYPQYFQGHNLSSFEKQVQKSKLEKMDTYFDLSVHLSRL